MTDATNEVPKPLNPALKQINFIFEPVSFIENYKREVGFEIGGVSERIVEENV